MKKRLVLFMTLILFLVSANAKGNPFEKIDFQNFKNLKIENIKKMNPDIKKDFADKTKSLDMPHVHYKAISPLYLLDLGTHSIILKHLDGIITFKNILPSDQLDGFICSQDYPGANEDNYPEAFYAHISLDIFNDPSAIPCGDNCLKIRAGWEGNASPALLHPGDVYNPESDVRKGPGTYPIKLRSERDGVSKLSAPGAFVIKSETPVPGTDDSELRIATEVNGTDTVMIYPANGVFEDYNNAKLYAKLNADISAALALITPAGKPFAESAVYMPFDADLLEQAKQGFINGFPYRFGPDMQNNILSHEYLQQYPVYGSYEHFLKPGKYDLNVVYVLNESVYFKKLSFWVNYTDPNPPIVDETVFELIEGIGQDPENYDEYTVFLGNDPYGLLTNPESAKVNIKLDPRATKVGFVVRRGGSYPDPFLSAINPAIPTRDVPTLGELFNGTTMTPFYRIPGTVEQFPAHPYPFYYFGEPVGNYTYKSPEGDYYFKERHYSMHIRYEIEGKSFEKYVEYWVKYTQPEPDSTVFESAGGKVFLNSKTYEVLTEPELAKLTIKLDPRATEVYFEVRRDSYPLLFLQNIRPEVPTRDVPSLEELYNGYTMIPFYRIPGEKGEQFPNHPYPFYTYGNTPPTHQSPEGDYYFEERSYKVDMFYKIENKYFKKTMEYQVKYTDPVAIAEAGKPGVEIYPNPVADMLNIKTDAQVQNVQLLDLYGRPVKDLGSAKQINVSAVPAGMYILKIKLNGGEITKKIVKQ